MDGWNFKTFLVILLLSPIYVFFKFVDFANEHEFIAMMMLFGFTGILIWMDIRRRNRILNRGRAIYNSTHRTSSGIPLPTERNKNFYE